MLYSNLIVEREREEDSNHYIVGPLKRVLLGFFGKLGMFNRQKEWELVTVIASDVESIRRQLVIAPVAPFKVFAGLVEKKGWERAGCCHWSAPMSPYIYTSVPGRENPITEKDAPNILPYVIPFFQLRCMISQIVSNEKGRDFYVVSSCLRLQSFCSIKQTIHKLICLCFILCITSHFMMLCCES